MGGNQEGLDSRPFFFTLEHGHARGRAPRPRHPCRHPQTRPRRCPRPRPPPPPHPPPGAAQQPLQPWPALRPARPAGRHEVLAAMLCVRGVAGAVQGVAGGGKGGAVTACNAHTWATHSARTHSCPRSSADPHIACMLHTHVAMRTSAPMRTGTRTHAPAATPGRPRPPRHPLPARRPLSVPRMPPAASLPRRARGGVARPCRPHRPPACVWLGRGGVFLHFFEVLRSCVLCYGIDSSLGPHARPP